LDYKQILLDAGKRMLHSGLTVETWGNISVRDPETQKVYLTPSAMSYDTCVPDDIVVCDLNGNTLEGRRKPTIEKELHLLVYQNRPEVNAVIHTHPIHSMVFACTKTDIPQVIDEAAQVLGDTVRAADYALPGSHELASNCVKTLGKNANACLLQSHGAVCVGKDMISAFKVAHVLEMTAEIFFMTLQIGKEAIPISGSDIAAMKEFAEKKYGQGK
jgi:L-fuculose-phosphate aldolase